MTATENTEEVPRHMQIYTPR